MRSVITEPSKSDPNRVTIKFPDGSNATFVLQNGKVIRTGIELPNFRDLGDIEKAFGVRHLARAEEAAYKHFQGQTVSSYESVTEARAVEFSTHVRISTGGSRDASIYRDRFLIPLAREFLKRRGWDMDEKTLIEATRSFWKKVSDENAEKKHQDNPDRKRRAERKEFLRDLKERQGNLFAI